MATAKSVGHMDKFDPATVDIDVYLERVELFFAANKTEDADKVTILLNVIGGKTYCTVCCVTSWLQQDQAPRRWNS